jgi:glycosyltransferase involved in cell wall biosynthesis
MRIALFTDGIQPYVTGGMQKHSFYLAKYLARQGVEIELYHFAVHEDAGDPESLDAFEAEERERIENHLFEWPKEDPFPGHYIRASYRYSERIYWEFREEGRADLIIAKGFAGWRAIEAKTDGEELPPIAVKFHGMNMFQKPPSFKGWLAQFLFRKPVRFNMKHAERVLSYGGRISDVIERQGIPKERIIEAPAGIEADWLKPPKGELHTPRRFLFVGRYDRLKGLGTLLNAVRAIPQDKAFELHLVGDIPERFAAGDERVQIHGPIHDAERMKEFYDRCDVLLLPSHSEGMPNVLLEAMGRGMTAIATDVGAVNELLSDDRGRLIARPSQDLISRAMEGMIEMSDEDLLELQKRAYEHVKANFLWEEIVGGLLGELKNIRESS